MVWSLGVTDQRRLVSAFMGVNALRSRRTRDLYVSILERELGHPLPFDRHDQDQLDLWGLVDCCLSYSGAMHALVAVVEGFQQSSTPVLHVKDLVAELLPDPLLEPLERRQLHELTQALRRAEIDKATITTLYRRAVGPLGPELDPGLHQLPVVIAQLEEVVAGADRLPPLLVFVAELGGYTDAQTAQALRDWVTRCASRLGLDLAQGSLPEPVKAGHDHRSAYLVIECLPDGAGSGGYVTSAWLQYDEEPGLTLRCDDEPRPLAQIARLLEALVREDQRVVNRSVPELTIEFVLPRILLNAPVDQFKITVDDFERRVGIDFPVLVRSQDRLHRQTMHHNWRRKWLRFREHPEAATPWLVERPRQHDGEWLYATLCDHSSACLAMAFPPSRHDAVDELWIGLQAGIPILLWCRDGGERFLPEFRELMQTDLRSLPQRVLELRQEAVRTAQGMDHIGFHLTLIYDDADRIPAPYVRLGAPT
jgi:hypothetical protein